MTDQELKSMYEYFGFCRFGYTDFIGVNIKDSLLLPEKFDNLDRVKYYDESAARTMNEMQKVFQGLKLYRQRLAEIYNELATAPQVPGVKLIRRRDCWKGNKVFYDLITYTKYIDSGNEVETSRKTYAGMERRQAIDDFKAYCKNHPGIESVMDIAKSKWEK